MNKRRMLLSYMIEKSNLVYEIIGERLYDPRDYIDTIHWSKKDVKRVIREMKKASYRSFRMSAVEACPQCKLNNINCVKCSYAAFHGQCLMKDGYFRYILHSFKNEKTSFQEVLETCKLFIRYNF